MLGTFVNAGAVIVGGIAGMLFNKSMPDRFKTIYVITSYSIHYTKLYDYFETASFLLNYHCPCLYITSAPNSKSG